MESQRERYVNMIFAALGLLVAYISLIGLQKLVAVTSLEASVKQIDLIVRGVSLVLGAGVGFGLYWNDRATAYMNEVMIELGKVTWPTSQDTSKLTTLVIIMVVISGFILGFFDWVLTSVMKAIL